MPICILGMHRSGTSMVTRLLHECGLYLGEQEDLLSASEENPGGYWENRHFVEFNDELLALLGGTWDQPPALEPGWSQGAEFGPLRHRVRGLTAGFDARAPWGWKDPRNSLTLEFWLSVFPDLKVVLCMRNPVEIAQSLSRRAAYHVSYADSLELWRTYHEAILNALPPERCIVTHYHTYFYDPAAELRRLLASLDLEASEAQMTRAVSTVAADYRRSFDVDQLLKKQDLPRSVLQHYLAFCAEAGPVYARMVQDAGHQAGLLERKVHQLYDENARTQKLLTMREAALTETSQAMQRQRAEYEALIDQHIAEKSALVSQHREEIDALHELTTQRLEALLQKVKAEHEAQARLYQARETQVIKQYEDRLQAAESVLRAIQSTRGWRLLNRWWRFKSRLMPEGSRRARAYYLLRSSIEILFTGGLFALLNRLRKWLRGERRYYRKLPDSPSNRLQTVAQPIPAARSGASEPFAVLYVVTADFLLSKRYRAYNIVEQLRKRGIRAEVIEDKAIAARLNAALPFDVVVFHRLPLTPLVIPLIDLAHQRRIPIVFDMDDYVFNFTVLPYIDAIRDFSDEQMAQYTNGIRLYREFVLAADFFTGATQTLVDAAAELGTEGFVIRNGLNDEQVRLAEEALSQRDAWLAQDDWIRIGYLPGTHTHRKDFAVALPALVRLLSEFPNVMLSIRGHLDLPPELAPFRSRIELHPPVSWEALVGATAALDINIAPLELNNPFTAAKSALKYFEPALVEVPTVATPTEDFALAIRHGVNAFLAATDEEWYTALRALVTDAALRREMGRRAREDALRRYTSEAQSHATLRVFQQILGRHYGLRMTWLMLRPVAGSGGSRMIIRMAHQMHLLGHHVRVYVGDDKYFRSDASLKAFVHEHFIDTPVEFTLFRVGIDAIEPCDALIATFWVTAHAAHKQAAKARKVFYFVQDYEPLFYDMHEEHEEHTLAERTYRLGLTHITIGKWLTHMLRERYGARADWFPFPIDHSVYYPRESERLARRRIVFLARPDMPYRCYSLGLEALRRVHRQHPDVEIVLYGSDQIVSQDIPFPYTDRGIISDLVQLADLYRSADVGIVFSKSNPSVVPLELMACGCPVVELDTEMNRVHFGSEAPALLVAEEAERVAEAVHRLLVDEAFRQQKVQAGLSFAQALPTFEQAARRVETLIFEGLFGSISMPSPPDHSAYEHFVSKPAVEKEAQE